MPLPRVAQSAERMVYRVAGLPIATAVIFNAQETDRLRSEFAKRYWHPESPSEWVELIAALAFWPFVVASASIWSTARNGAVIRKRYGKSITVQLKEQIFFYFRFGVLAPWYYIFSLHDDGANRAKSYLHRFETKTCYFKLLKHKKGTPLTNKPRFAEYCASHNIRCVQTLATFFGTDPGQSLPDCDLFIKPIAGRGGRGAERWDLSGPSTFIGPAGERLGKSELVDRLVQRSKRTAVLVQKRLNPHPDLVSLTSGALPTLRVLTCLNEEDEPEVAAAMMRTSFGANRTVDNLHAGGIGALVEVDSGKLSKSSNLGADARLGWFSSHPDTGSPIEGNVVPLWDDVKKLAVKAHSHFSDRVVVGWDIAVLDDGPIIVEGNGNPDLDILQRFMRIGLRDNAFADLLAYHLSQRGALAWR